MIKVDKAIEYMKNPKNRIDGLSNSITNQITQASKNGSAGVLVPYDKKDEASIVFDIVPFLRTLGYQTFLDNSYLLITWG